MASETTRSHKKEKKVEEIVFIEMHYHFTMLCDGCKAAPKSKGLENVVTEGSKIEAARRLLRCIEMDETS